MSSLARIEELERKYAESPRRFFAPLANEFRKAGDSARAIELCRAHLEQQPNHMSGQVVLGQALFDAGMRTESRAAFELALSLDPENLIALRHLGDLAREAGDLQIARKWYSQVLDVDSRNHEVISTLRELDDLLAASSFDAADRASVQVESEPAEEIAVGREEDSPYRPEQSSASDVAVDGLPAAVTPPSPIEFVELAELPSVVDSEVSLGSAAEADDAAADVADSHEAAPEVASEEPWEPVRPDEEASRATSEADAPGDSVEDEPQQVSSAEILEREEEESFAASQEYSEPRAFEEMAAAIGAEKWTDAAAPALEHREAEEAGPLQGEDEVAAASAGYQPWVEESQELDADAEADPLVPPMAATHADTIVSTQEEVESPSISVPPADETAPAYDADSVSASGSGELFASYASDESAAVDDQQASEIDDALAWDMEMMNAQVQPDAELQEEWLPGFELAASQPEEQSPYEEEEDLSWPEPKSEPLSADAPVDMSHMDFVEQGHGEVEDDEVSSSAPAVFINETMARLYVSQGYVEMAVAVYKQLLERDPENDSLRGRLAELEGQMAGQQAAPRDRRSIPASEEDSAKSFFSSLLKVPLRPRLARPYVSIRADVDPAVGTGIGDTTPAREATSALSLDSVFRNGGVGGSGFSFDHFFTTGGQAPPTGGAPEKEPRTRRRRGEDTEEIEQFNSWLEGLKRS